MDISVAQLADTLVSQSTLFNCSIEEAWEKYMHPYLTKQSTFEEVKSYIDDQIALGKEFRR